MSSWPVVESQTQSEASDTAVTTRLSSLDQVVIVTLPHNNSYNMVLIRIRRKKIDKPVPDLSGLFNVYN